MAIQGEQRQSGGNSPADQAYWLLRTGFTVAPILAGADKFTERLVEWEKYLSPTFDRLSPMSPRTFMKTVGVVEIAAGVLVATKPALGSYVVAGWLGGIIGNLLTHPRRYGDIALRDLGLALGALALGRLEAERTARRREGTRSTYRREFEGRREFTPNQQYDVARGREETWVSP